MRQVPGTSLAALAICLLLAGCAQIGPPLPPSLELPKPPVDLHATRKGNTVTLTWSEPRLTTDRQSVRYIGPTRICRTTEAEMTQCDNPVGSTPVPQNVSKTATVQSPPQLYSDTLPEALQEQNPTGEITYAVEVLNRDGRGAGLSNRVHVPAVPTLPPPQDLAAQLTPTGVDLAWTNPGAGVTSPEVTHRDRIYRRDESTGKDAVAGELPFAETGPAHFLDSTFEWEHAYLYRVVIVSIVTNSGGEVQVEGADTAPVRVVAHDVFPPAVPAGLQAVYSGEGQKPFVDLVWAPVTSADLAGYIVYRHEAGSAPTQLNSQLAKSPSYRDDAVAFGKTYFYSVSAVDLRGNESAKSEETSETVPARD